MVRCAGWRDWRQGSDQTLGGEGRGHSVDVGPEDLIPSPHSLSAGDADPGRTPDRVTPEQLFVSVQDAAAHALERLVRWQ